MDNNQNTNNQNGQYTSGSQYTQGTANDPYAQYSQNVQYTQNTQNTQYPYGSPYAQNGQYSSGSQYGGANIGTPVIENSRRGLGVLGAALGALAGGVIWAIIGMLGFVSGWISVLIILLARWGYKLLSKTQDTFGNVISIIFGLIVIFPATWAAYAFSAWKALSEIGNFSYLEVVFDLGMYMNRYDWWGDFWMNLAMGYGFTIFIGLCYFIGNRRYR